MRYYKHKSLVFALLGITILLGACKKGFINDIKPTNSVLADELFASTDAVRVYFNGIYRNIRGQWISTDGSAGGSTDTWGYNSVFLTRNVKGKDVVEPFNNWYYFDYQNDNREPTYRRVKFVWYFFYELINQLNVLIDGTQKSTTILDADKNALIAEARALRGYFYFELIREFQFTYAKDPSAPGIPIYTTPTTDTTRGNPRGTVQQVYDQINSDFDFALANIGQDQLLKDQVNYNVAWGMAARIYLEQGRWADAETAATNAMQGHDLDADGYANNYNGGNSTEVIWSFPQTQEDGGQSVYFGTPSAFYCQAGDGYDAFWMSQELVNTFTPTDVRYSFYATDDDPSEPDYFATNKFGAPNGLPDTLINGNIVPMNTVDFNESLNMLRMGELYLIEAEAKARLNEADAHDVLYTLQKNRDPGALKSTATGQALIDEILLERRKELYGEMGIDWMDAKRLQLDIDRSHSNHAIPNNFIIPANDPSFILKIPQAELQANKSLSAADQNP